MTEVSAPRGHNNMSLEGKPFEDVFPWFTGYYESNGPVDLFGLLKWIDEGKPIFVEWTKGARKGSVGRVKITREGVENSYKFRERRTYYHGSQGFYRENVEFEVEFDGRKSLKLDSKKNEPIVFRFTEQPTVYSYVQKARPKEELPKIHDTLGNELQVGSNVMFYDTDSHKLRVGRIERWSPKMTIWIEYTDDKGKMISWAKAHHRGMISLDAFQDLKDAVTMLKLSGNGL